MLHFFQMATYLLYDKTVKLDFRDKGHAYTVSHLISEGVWGEPRDVTGVTTVKEILAKPGLIPWAAKLASKTYTEKLENFLAVGDEELTPAMLAEMEKQAGNAHNLARRAGGKAGSEFHNLAELYVKGEELPKVDKVSQDLFDKFRQWWDGIGYKPLMIEQPLYSRNLNLAGTLDILAEAKDDRKILLSLKTSNASRSAPQGIYITDFLQDGGYALMLKEMFDLVVDDIEVFNPNGVDLTVRASDFGMSVIDSMTYFDRIHSAWQVHHKWESIFRRA